MSELPPPFYADPTRALLALEPGHPDFVGPADFARRSAVHVLRRNDAAMAELLYRAWRSGAPDELLDRALLTYAGVHELDPDEAEAVYDAARLFLLDDRAQARLPLVTALRDGVGRGVEECLTAVQGEDEPCRCPACIAEAAGLN